MITTIGYIIFFIYTFALVYVTIFCLMQFHLLTHYSRHHNKNVVVDQGEFAPGDYPFVTIQLPIFNEKYVVERLIDNIVKLDYPKDRFEIHILDDSNDETIEITQKKVAEYKKQGFQIEQVTREIRQGFKAGALRDGMDKVKGEFIAIFDADFLPKPDFLKKTIPSFKDPKVGVVQTRWEHINKDYSLITRLQAFQLNVHFSIEQQGREAGDYLLQFNGTAGVWRKETITSAGGWEADTLTEDLDLSYRAQLRGWKILFLEEVGSPAELPAEMNGLKSQQFRWMKGGAETAKKILPTIWHSDLGFTKKIHASIHLLSSSVFLCVFLLGVFSVPLLFFLNVVNLTSQIFPLFILGLFAIIFVYLIANTNKYNAEGSKWKALVKSIFIFPLFLALSMGLSLHNSIAVLQGYWGKKSPFVRTPKLNINSITDTIKKSTYLNYKLNKTTMLEGFLTLYFLFGAMSSYFVQDYTFLLLHILLFIGYGTIFYYTVSDMRYRT